MCPHTPIYVSSCYYTCVLILLCMCTVYHIPFYCSEFTAQLHVGEFTAQRAACLARRNLLLILVVEAPHHLSHKVVVQGWDVQEEEDVRVLNKHARKPVSTPARSHGEINCCIFCPITCFTVPDSCDFVANPALSCAPSREK